VIDTVDGTLARAVDVQIHVPRFSGERLDLVIDYVTYVFVPVVALLHAGFLSGLMGGITGGLILLSALYHFADMESKAADNCFVGFPAVWNIVAFCIFAWGAPGWLAVAISLALVALTFVPMHWVHPMRVGRLFWPNAGMAAVGIAAGIWVLATGFPGGVGPGLVLAAASLYFVALAVAWPVLRGAA
jgi:phosphatidylcholine synthase